MGAFFKKDVLVYWRDRKEMLVLLAMPLLLIVVLSFALPDWIENRAGTLDMTIAIVSEEREEEGLQRFRDELADASLPAEAAAAIAEAAEDVRPALHLRRMLASEEIASFVQTIDLPSADALERLEQGEIAAIVTIPEGFTTAALHRLLRNEGEVPALRLTANEYTLRLGVLRDVLDGYLDEWNFGWALGTAAAEEPGFGPASEPGEPMPIGGRESIGAFRALTSFQYYAVAVAILFSLFLAMSLAGKAITEKRERVFERMTLAGAHPVQYIAGKTASTFCLALLNLVVVLAICQASFRLYTDRDASFWLGLALILIVYCLAIGALAAFFTALAFRLQEASANGVMMIVVMLMGTIGGGFVPIYILPDALRRIGEWTPNGMSLAAYIQWVQQGAWEGLWMPLLQLTLFAAIVFCAGVWLFPRRGRI
ncbi:ABC transporter permease [Paenibacillus sp. TRM 82003]|nr:ABC transporter permease [Paenibacillus sp. TRM 82003]